MGAAILISVCFDTFEGTKSLETPGLNRMLNRHLALTLVESIKEVKEHFESNKMWNLAVNSTPVSLPLVNMSVPVMLLYLLANVTTQYVCISSVFVLTTECVSLTVTLVVTLRKFLSLIFSIWYFQNPFTLYHWIG